MNTVIVIPATSKKYFDLATNMKQSAEANKWKARFVIVSDIEGGGVHVTPSKCGGREYKQNFASFIPPNHDGPVVMMDADMQAVGPEPDWSSYKEIATVAAFEGAASFPKEYKPLGGFLSDGLMVICPNVQSAKELCAEWGKKGNYDNGSAELRSLRLISNKTLFTKSKIHSSSLPLVGSRNQGSQHHATSTPDGKCIYRR